MTVAAMTDTTRVLLKVLSDILPRRQPHSGTDVQLILTALDPSDATRVGPDSASPLEGRPSAEHAGTPDQSNHDLLS